MVNFDRNISMYQKEFFVSSQIIMNNSSFFDNIIDYVFLQVIF